MPGSLLHGTWEISSAPGEDRVGWGRQCRNPTIDADERSDAPIVPEKRPNNGESPAEVVEGRGAAEGNAGETPTHRTQSRGRVSRGLEGVRAAARRDRRARFTALLHHITPELLESSFHALRRDAAPGVDGMTWTGYAEDLASRIPDLHRRIHTGAYRATPSRRTYIPKADGRLRPLGIAALEDKIVQQAVVTVLSAIYETDFLGFSYGFRPGRSQHQALDALYVAIDTRPINWILDADIRAFFDEIDHTWIMRFLEHRIADRRILRLIRNWLKAGVIDEQGQRVPGERGTPQGAVISPLLANVYLHYVHDLWAHRWRRRNARGQVILVRYADDSVYGFQSEAEARQFLSDLRERFAQFGLELHPEKTRLIEFGRFAASARKRKGLGKPETFDFLGFTHICGKTRNGRFALLRLTVKKRMRASLAAIRTRLKDLRHAPIPEQGTWLNRVLRGYFNYHAVPGNLKRLDGFRAEVTRAWRQSLMRRSQKHRLPWSRCNKLVRRYFPSVKQLHPYPTVRFAS
jgi:group II intron reverse transcriptase/maturase